MFSGVTSRKYRLPYVFAILIAALLTTLADLYIIDYGISYREVIVTLVALAAFWVFAAGQRGLKVGLVFLVVTFGLGHRTMVVTPSLRVHPSELVILGLLVLLIMQQAIWRQNKVIVWLPTWLILFVPFWLWGWQPLISGAIKWELMFSEFKNFIILAPLYLLVSTVLVEKRGCRSVLLAFYFVALGLPLWGSWNICILRSKRYFRAS